MLKRLTFVCAVFLCLAFVACAEHTALFPAYDGAAGKWGYIDRQGTFVIPPQFDAASEFRGNYAAVAVYPGEAKDADWHLNRYSNCEGIIDSAGTFVLPPEDSVDEGYDEQYFGGRDTGIWAVNRWVKGDADRKEGFFDIPSGCFSGLKWEAVWHWCSDSRLIPVLNDGLEAGYADRTTGELVIPCQYFGVDPSVFCERVASVAFTDGNGSPEDFFLIDETGAVIPLPGSIHSLYGHYASDGRIAVTDEDGLLGFADLQGRVVVPPQFAEVKDFLHGFAPCMLPDGTWVVIDREGRFLDEQEGARIMDDWEEMEYELLMADLNTGFRETGEPDNGLIWVKDGGRCGYTDEEGREVYMWVSPSE